MSITTSKTEIIISRPRKKKITKHLNFRNSGQKIINCRNVKYLGIPIEENLEQNLHLNLLKSKLKRAIGLLCKLRHYVPKFQIKMLYYAIFHSYLIYACQIWVQSFNILTKIQTLQDNGLWVTNFKVNNHDVRDLYKNDQILKMSDYIKMLAELFICKRCTKKIGNSFLKLL